jgi:hypothetical protein
VSPVPSWPPLVLALALGVGPLASPARAGADEDLQVTADDDEVQWGRGPLEVQDPYLLAAPRLSPWVRSPEVLRSAQVEVGLRGVWANSYELAWGRYVVDGELREATAVVRVGLADRLELGLDLPLEWQGGGRMDHSIERFHDLFQLGQQGRTLRPRDAYEVAGRARDGRPFDLEDEGTSLGDLVPEARVLVLRGSAAWPALSATLRLRLPTGLSSTSSSRGVDVSLALDASKRVGPVVLYASAALTYLSPAVLRGLEYSRFCALVGAGFEVELGPRVSLVAHLWTQTARETDLERARPLFDGSASVSYVACGVKCDPIDGLRLELGVLENVLTQSASADFGLVANVSYRF